MKLTIYTDYSLRVLIYLAAKGQNELSNISEIADAYGISKNHLMKVTHDLGKMGILQTIRGRGGGIRLALPPEEINIGSIVRETEDDFKLVPCFGEDGGGCAISPVCGLKHVLRQALEAYLAVLDQYTVADIVRDPDSYMALFNIGPETSTV